VKEKKKKRPTGADRSEEKSAILKRRSVPMAERNYGYPGRGKKRELIEKCIKKKACGR